MKNDISFSKSTLKQMAEVENRICARIAKQMNDYWLRKTLELDYELTHRRKNPKHAIKRTK